MEFYADKAFVGILSVSVVYWSGVDLCFPWVAASDPDALIAVPPLWAAGRAASARGRCWTTSHADGRFLSEPEIILSCRGDRHHCSGLHRKGRTLHCPDEGGAGRKEPWDELPASGKDPFSPAIFDVKTFYLLRNFLFLSLFIWIICAHHSEL